MRPLIFNSSRYLDLIPVDCVMHDIREIVRNEFGRSMIYHLCARHGPSVSAVFTALCAAAKGQWLEACLTVGAGFSNRAHDAGTDPVLHSVRSAQPPKRLEHLRS
jgi:hypothetical protein